MTENKVLKDLLIVEPFNGGSHKQMVDLLVSIAKEKDLSFDLICMSAKKWHWRARTSALYVSSQVQETVEYKILLCSSVLNLSELVSLCPRLNKSLKIVYFHENQLVYPVRDKKDRDFQYGYNQILTCLVADKIFFNSNFNRTSFLDNISSFLKLIPDFRPKSIKEKIEPKSYVLYFPLSSRPVVNNLKHKIDDGEKKVLRIVWPHRWEFDKDPEMFFKVLFEMKDVGIDFKVSILGQSFQDVPAIFQEAKEKLGDKHIEHFGHLENKESYYSVLSSSDVVVSTAKHEFFGVAMLEATMCGCYPLCPNSLSYPEIYPKSCLYNTDRQLFKRLKRFALFPEKPKLELRNMNFDLQKFTIDELKPSYVDILTNS